MSNRNSSQSQRSLLGTLAAIVLLVLAIIISQLTGIDFIGVLTGEATPTPTAAPTEPGTPIATVPGEAVVELVVPQGFGAEHSFWQVFFTQPSGSSDEATYTGGIDTQLAAAIGGARSTLDIAAYEFNNEILTEAVIEAHERGVRVRVVTDDEAGIEDDETTLSRLIAAGIPVVDDDRTDLMHNKFVIIDGSVVWTGSWNLTINGTYRNNNNVIRLRSRRAVENFQAEFDEMFIDRQFGPTSPANTPNPTFTQDGVPIGIYFAPEDDVTTAMIDALRSADSHIRIMTFSFTLDDVRDVILAEAASGVQVEGIFDSLQATRPFSELIPLHCAGLPMRTDGGRFILHHKVFIIDDDTVVTGSFNFSANATEANDENLLIIQDPVLAAQFIAEFERRWQEAEVPTGIDCS